MTEINNIPVPIRRQRYLVFDVETTGLMPRNTSYYSEKSNKIDDYPYTLTVENVEEFCFALDEYINYRPKKGVLKKWLSNNQWSNRVDEFLRLSKIHRNDGISKLGAEES